MVSGGHSTFFFTKILFRLNLFFTITPEIFLDPKFLLDSKKILDWKFFFGPKIFFFTQNLTRHFFWPKFLWNPNIFDQIFVTLEEFWDLKCLRNLNDLTSNFHWKKKLDPNYFTLFYRPKVYFGRNIYWTPKKIFGPTIF